MFLLIFIYALIGMQFFGDKADTQSDDPTMRTNFSTFLRSLLSIFQVLTGENWNEVMYIIIDNYGFASSLYFVSLIVFGNFMILNLFLAILLQNISENVTEGEGDAESEGASLEDEEIDFIQESIRLRGRLKQEGVDPRNEGTADPVDVRF